MCVGVSETERAQVRLLTQQHDAIDGTLAAQTRVMGVQLSDEEVETTHGVGVRVMAVVEGMAAVMAQIQVDDVVRRDMGM